MFDIRYWMFDAMWMSERLNIEHPTSNIEHRTAEPRRTVGAANAARIPTTPHDVHNSLFFAAGRKNAAQLSAWPAVKNASAVTGRRTGRG
jgi:hypothetical protein